MSLTPKAIQLTWGIDISNWNGLVTAQNLADWTGAGLPACMIRASLESQRLMDISIQQFTAAKPVIQTTFPYAWCYGSDVPEQVVTNTIQLCDGLASEKKIVFDVEDLTNFVTHFAGLRSQALFIPRRYLATTAAQNESAKPRFGFSAIPPSTAVNWLIRAFAETRKQGWEPCVYSAAWCWYPLMGNSTAFASEKWLLAQFDENPDLSVYASVGGVQELMGKQYSDKGRIPFGDPNSPQYDFSSYDLSKLITAPPVVTPPSPPTPPTDGPDVPNAYQRAKNARSELAPLIPYIPRVALADVELENLEQDLSHPGGPS